MAVLSQAIGSQPDITIENSIADLSQLLARIDQSVRLANDEKERASSSGEVRKTKLGQDIEHALGLLTEIEQQVRKGKPNPSSLKLQSDLKKKRDLLDQLVIRTRELETSRGALRDPRRTMSSLPQTQQPPRPDRSDPPVDSIASGPASTTDGLRQRGHKAPSAQETSYTSARAALFAQRRSTIPNKSVATVNSSTATAEAILDHQRAEQDALSDSILKMASALKSSSQRFSSTLEEDKALLSRAGEGMDKTERGMDAASRRMGALKRMTEGKGWWGRMMLYAWIYGLMVALILLVFVLPKLRF